MPNRTQPGSDQANSLKYYGNDVKNVPFCGLRMLFLTGKWSFKRGQNAKANRHYILGIFDTSPAVTIKEEILLKFAEALV